MVNFVEAGFSRQEGIKSDFTRSKVFMYANVLRTHTHMSANSSLRISTWGGNFHKDLRRDRIIRKRTGHLPKLSSSEIQKKIITM